MYTYYTEAIKRVVTLAMYALMHHLILTSRSPIDLEEAPTHTNL